MKVAETISTSPIATEKSIRGEEVRVLTSCRAGKIVPVKYIPLLREDSVRRGSVRLVLDMAETIHPLMNSVNVTAFAHFVPFLAFDRFNGMDSFNRSYKGEGELHNGTPIPFFTQAAFDRNGEFYKTLGIHAKQTEQVNGAPIEAYNTLVNFRRQARSKHLPMRTWAQKSLAQAFWRNPNMWHIVPDFDQAAMDGEVELQWATPRLKINGIGRKFGASQTVENNVTVYDNGVQTTYPKAAKLNDPAYYFNVMANSTNGTPEVFAELQSSGIRLSLQNIELAKKTAAFAKLRDKYSGLDDDHIIDLLMEGIRVPDEALKQPILLDKRSTIFGYSERHAMDGASLDRSVTTGHTELTLNFRTPPMNVGGIILITLEIVPEQLFERMEDKFLSTGSPDQLPNFLRDYLDPEKVDVVQNRFVDVEHSNPDGTFGYAPLNHHWKRSLTNIGGKYYRQNPDTWVEDRQRFWSVEQLNPTLTDDFYMVPQNLPHSVFMDTISDPFEVMAVGSVQIMGNTVFGRTLEEDNGNYDAVYDQIDTSRIQQA